MSKKLIQSSGIFSLMTFLSRILGFVRDMVAAYVFGAGPGYDAFILAFRIPNLMRRLFAEGAFSQAFVPVLSEYRLHKEHEQTQQFVSNIAGSLGLALLLITILGMWGAPLLIKLFAPGFVQDGERVQLASNMLRITFPYIFFISLTALAGGILNAYDRFAAAAFTPVFLNVCMITASLCFAGHLLVPEMSLAWAVALAGLVQCVFLWPFLKKINLLVWPKICWQDPGVRRVLTLMLPALLGAAVGQINIFIDTLFASFLPRGSISWLYYSDRLMEFPLGIFGVGLATVILPNLSRQYAARSTGFSATLDWGLRSVLLVGVPATIGLYLLAGPILATLFQSGKFLAADVVMSSKSLMAYALAVVGLMMAKILSSAFYACQDIKTPVRIGIVILVVNAVLNSLLIIPLAHAGLALATSIASILNAFILYIMLVKRGMYKIQAGWGWFLMRLSFASCALYTAIATVTPELAIWINWSTKTRVYWLLPLIGLGVVVYSGVLLLCGLRPRDLLVSSC